MHKLILDNIYKSYNKRNILKNVSAEFKRGEVILLTGKNGSGKTTLLKIITGLLKADKGKILKNNLTLGYYSHEFMFYEDLSLLENLNFFINISNIKCNILDEVSKWKISHLKNTSFKKLSKGEKSKASLLMCFLNNPKYIILDEPTAFLDKEGIDLLISKIKENVNNSIILIASHDLYNFHKICNRFFIIKDLSLEEITTETLTREYLTENR